MKSWRQVDKQDVPLLAPSILDYASQIGHANPHSLIIFLTSQEIACEQRSFRAILEFNNKSANCSEDRLFPNFPSQITSVYGIASSRSQILSLFIFPARRSLVTPFPTRTVIPFSQNIAASCDAACALVPFLICA